MFGTYFLFYTHNIRQLLKQTIHLIKFRLTKKEYDDAHFKEHIHYQSSHKTPQSAQNKPHRRTGQRTSHPNPWKGLYLTFEALIHLRAECSINIRNEYMTESSQLNCIRLSVLYLFIIPVDLPKMYHHNHNCFFFLVILISGSYFKWDNINCVLRFSKF